MGFHHVYQAVQCATWHDDGHPDATGDDEASVVRAVCDEDEDEDEDEDDDDDDDDTRYARDARVWTFEGVRSGDARARWRTRVRMWISARVWARERRRGCGWGWGRRWRERERTDVDDYRVRWGFD